MLNESVHDNGALKFVFLAGGPGSGKNYVANELFGIGKDRTFGASGMKLVSFDNIFERLLKKKGYGTDLSTLSEDEKWEITSPANPKSLFSTCRKLVKKQLANCVEQGVGVIFDGTGQFVNSYYEKKDMAEDTGYDTFLIYVKTPLKTALERNAKRERRLPDEMVAQLYRSVKMNEQAFKDEFGDNMIVVNNDDGQKITNDLRGKINKIISQPVKNPIGQEWLTTGVRKKKEKPKHIQTHNTPFDTHTPQSDGSHKSTKSYQTNMFTKGKYDNPWASSYSDYKKTPDPYGPQKFVPKKPGSAPQPYKPTSYGSGYGDKNPFLEKFKQQSASKQNASGGTPMKQPEKVQSGADHVDLTGKMIRNPETGNDILVTTALGYEPNHPARIAAEKFLNK